MASLSGEAFKILASWDDEADRVTSPDLRATWCRLQVWVDGRCTTSVRGREGGPRDEVHGAAYPLAEWIVFNWWSLVAEQRPAAVEDAAWSWRHLPDQAWLRRHNMRAANEGQAWPDLTMVREGDVFAAVWEADEATTGAPVQFLTSGKAFVRASTVVEGLRAFVHKVIGRLADQGVHDTPLAKEWQRLQKSEADGGESAFCLAVARLGLDPYDTVDDIADRLPMLAAELGEGLLGDFLDSADPAHLQGALDWLTGARDGLPAPRTAPLLELRSALTDQDQVDGERAWLAGYEAAKAVRRQQSLAATVPVDALTWVTVAHRQADPHGLSGYGATRQDDRCILLVPQGLGRGARQFTAARALGRALFQPLESEFLLTSTRATHERVARAFAAELLAPAAGIDEMLNALQLRDDAAYDAVADRYGVSPLVVKLQAHNQLA